MKSFLSGINLGGICVKKIANVLLLLLFIPSIFAIRAEIGNVRVVINTKWEGEQTIERTILVRNSNDVPVDITLASTEEIKDIITILDENFRLNPGEEKKARFNIVLKKPGKWSGKISVYFKPEEGNTVALASNLFINAKASDNVNIPSDIPSDILNEEEQSGQNFNESEKNKKGTVDFKFGGTDLPTQKMDSSAIFILIIVIIILVGALSGGIYLLRK